MTDSETPERCPGFPVIGGPCDKTLREVEVLPTQALLTLVEKWEDAAINWRGCSDGVEAIRSCVSDLRQLLDPLKGASNER